MSNFIETNSRYEYLNLDKVLALKINEQPEGNIFYHAGYSVIAWIIGGGFIHVSPIFDTEIEAKAELKRLLELKE